MDLYWEFLLCITPFIYVIFDSVPRHQSDLHIATSTLDSHKVYSDQLVFYFFEDNYYFETPTDMHKLIELNQIVPYDQQDIFTVEYHPKRPETIITMAKNGQAIVSYDDYVAYQWREFWFLVFGVLCFLLVLLGLASAILYAWTSLYGNFNQLLLKRFPGAEKVNDTYYRIKYKGFEIFYGVEWDYVFTNDSFYEEEFILMIKISDHFTPVELKRISRMKAITKNSDGETYIKLIAPKPVFPRPKSYYKHFDRAILEAKKWSKIPLRGKE